ncbi:MAG TPA: hypothetical protein VL326_24935 [Kofleriaceae bacterium]|nr:hypothetical protein [Kofleriaceae bacterium]
MRTILLLGVLGACGDDAMSQPDAGPASDAPVLACATDEIAWHFTVRDTDFGGSRLAGAHICLIDPAGACVDTPTTGAADFCVRANSRFAISAELAGYMPLIAPLVAGDAEPSQTRANTISLGRTTQSCTTWESAGVACPPTTQGLVWVKTVLDQPSVPEIPDPIGGVSIAAAGAIDVFYSNPTKDSSLTATDPGWGNAYAVFAGDAAATITLSRPNQVCRAFSFDAWPGAAGTIEVPVRAGFRTFVMATCQ